MSKPQTGNRHAPPQPSLLGLVAVASSLMTFVGMVLLLIAGACVLWFKPDLSKDALLPLAIGGGILGGIIIALIGIAAAVADSMQSSATLAKSGPVFASLVINGCFCLLVVGMVALSWLNS